MWSPQIGFIVSALMGLTIWLLLPSLPPTAGSWYFGLTITIYVLVRLWMRRLM